MILYNSDYKFVGISDSYIKKLNFPSFNALKYRIGDDFANLFIEKKGFLYNFKYLSWIDYILQNRDKAQAILKGGGHNFYKVSFSIEPYYFMENSEKGYYLIIETMSEYEMESLDIDNSNFTKTDEKLLYHVDEDEYHVYNEDSFNSSSELSFKETPTSSFSNEESETLSFNNLDNFQGTLPEQVPPQIETVSKKNIPSPEEFLRSFDVENSGDENIQTDLSEEKISFQLKQKSIDKLIENGVDYNIEAIQETKTLKIFQSDNYIIDEVSKELEIKKDTLIDFLIDFINHTNNLKPHIYDSLKHHNIKNVKNAVFMLKGLSFNLRIMDIYNIFEKIYSSYYRDTSELSKDINLIYEKTMNLNKQINSGGETLKFENRDVRPFISQINNSTLPDILFQDISDNFIKLFDSSKDRIEEILNPNKVIELKHIFEKLSNISKPLNIYEINISINGILNNISEEKIEFDKLIFSWIELTNFIQKMR